MWDKRSGKTPLRIALVVLLLCAIGALALLLLPSKDDGQIATEIEHDPNAAVSRYEGEPIAETDSRPDETVGEGMFNITISSAVTLASGSDKAQLRIENIAANHYLMGVEISLDDTGEVVYTSGLIAPGYSIQSAPLSVTLKKGDYAATALFTAYDMETEALAGQAEVKITITVQN